MSYHLARPAVHEATRARCAIMPSSHSFTHMAHIQLLVSFDLPRLAFSLIYIVIALLINEKINHLDLEKFIFGEWQRLSRWFLDYRVQL